MNPFSPTLRTVAKSMLAGLVPRADAAQADQFVASGDYEVH